MGINTTVPHIYSIYLRLYRVVVLTVTIKRVLIYSIYYIQTLQTNPSLPDRQTECRNSQELYVIFKVADVFPGTNV